MSDAFFNLYRHNFIHVAISALRAMAKPRPGLPNLRRYLTLTHQAAGNCQEAAMYSGIRDKIRSPIWARTMDSRINDAYCTLAAALSGLAIPTVSQCPPVRR